jgi:hypothetical protein
MAIDINIPSQVKNYANLAGFPVTGSLKTIYIAEDTNKTYRWTGSAYVEISASQAASWGSITGTLSSQTDLQTALNAKQDSLGFTPVPTTRTLTINGTTQDLSADRTFTISTGITIGTTAITSGTVGRVLFQGTGNVVSESANLFWDNTNGRLGIGTSAPAYPLDVQGIITFRDNATTSRGFLESNANAEVFLGSASDGSGSPTINLMTGGIRRLRVESTGNVLINTTTDAGFKLDVNGSVRLGTSNYIKVDSSGQPKLIWGETVDRISIQRGSGNQFIFADTSNYAYISNGRVEFGNTATYGTGSASAILSLLSTTQGFLPPRLTTTQKNAIATPAEGLQVWDTTLKLMSVYNGTTWITL